MKTVLIVDDQADLRRLVRWSLEVLEPAPAVHEATQGAAALELARQIAPDLVLLDVMMPGTLSGLQVCQQIRATPALAHTKVVLLSARGQISDIQAGTAAGAHAYLVKPFSPQRLAETAGRLLAA